MNAMLGPMDDMELAQESSESGEDSSDSCSGSSCSESGSTMTLAQQELSGYGSEVEAAIDVCADDSYGEAFEACMDDLLGSVDEDLSGDN